MENTPQLDQQTIQNLLGNSNVGASLIPESFGTILTISLVVTTVLMLIFVIFYALGSVRKWKVQSAVIVMQKDIADIKQSLAGSRPSQDTPLQAQTQVEGKSRVIAVKTDSPE